MSVTSRLIWASVSTPSSQRSVLVPPDSKSAVNGTVRWFSTAILTPRPSRSFEQRRQEGANEVGVVLLAVEDDGCRSPSSAAISMRWQHLVLGLAVHRQAVGVMPYLSSSCLMDLADVVARVDVVGQRRGGGPEVDSVKPMSASVRSESSRP